MSLKNSSNSSEVHSRPPWIKQVEGLIHGELIFVVDNGGKDSDNLMSIEA